MSTLIAIDNGSTAIKYCWKNKQGEVKTGVFKSRYVDKLQMASLDYMESAYDMEEGPVTIDQNASNPIKTDTYGYQYSHYVRAGVYEALRQIGVKGEVDIVITLPISHFYLSGVKGGINVDNINKAKENLLKGITASNLEVELPKIKSVRVYPEGIAALAELSRNEDGKLREGYNLNDKALIIDIGGASIDIALLSNLKGELQEKLSLNEGTLTLIDEFTAQAKSKLKSGTVMTREFAEMAFLGEKLRGEDYSEEVKSASRKLISTILREIEGITSDPMLNHAFILGGGAKLAGEALKARIEGEKGVQVVIPEDPETTLVRSIFRHESTERKKNKKVAEAV